MVFPSNIIVSPEKTAIKSDLSSSFNNTDNNSESVSVEISGVLKFIVVYKYSYNLSVFSLI